MGLLEGIIAGLIATALASAGVWVWRWWRKRGQPDSPQPAGSDTPAATSTEQQSVTSPGPAEAIGTEPARPAAHAPPRDLLKSFPELQDKWPGREAELGKLSEPALPSLVLRGSVGIVAGLGTRSRCFQGRELGPGNLATWQTLRAGPEGRLHTRALRQRFRRNPEGYLHQLEALLLKRTLPP